MKGNLMDSIVSLVSIAKRYDLGINIYSEGLYLVNDKECRCELIDVKDPEFLSKDFDDVCKRFKEKKNEHAGTVRNQ